MTKSKPDYPGYGTPKSLTEYQARIIPGTHIEWEQITHLKRNPPVLKSLTECLAPFNVTRALVTKTGTGSNRVVCNDFFTQESLIGPPFIALRWNPLEAADIVQLGPREAFVDLARDRMYFVARSEGRFPCMLAGRYTKHSASLIRDALEENHAGPERVCVSCYFGKESTFGRFQEECRQEGFRKVTHPCPERERTENEQPLVIIARIS